MKHLKYFEGKICTLITRETNRNFKDESIAMQKPELYPVNLLDHFMGRVIYIDVSCVVLEHPIIKTRSYFRAEHIIGIIEEQELDRTPENAKLIEDAKNKNAPPKVACPNGHILRVPADVFDGANVVCPACQVEFIIKKIASGWVAAKESQVSPDSSSKLVDIDILSKMSQEAKNL